MVRLTVDEKEIEAEEGKNLLQVCLENGITVPHLCFLEGMENSPASCRLCFVEIEGMDCPVPSCQTVVHDGMVVNTQSPAVRHLQRSALQLLLSAHRVDCSDCPANKRCALQQLAKLLGIPLKVKHLESLAGEVDTRMGHPLLAYDAGRCVLCGRCLYACAKHQEHPLLTFVRRGFSTRVDFKGKTDPAELPCLACLACVEICPVSALGFAGKTLGAA
ncbi:MAG: 2Fe-2S iron-sulfur cluster-binding protein [Deltaproteobacteria bacterium]|jgi:NADH dehydrogenase/NADH:ubiquinone oxidoreductase subunit G|nr:2Fe-2S iron-sulfur cluster-binding protein [Deltaproteobacteria bacterium]